MMPNTGDDPLIVEYSKSMRYAAVIWAAFFLWYFIDTRNSLQSIDKSLKSIDECWQSSLKKIGK